MESRFSITNALAAALIIILSMSTTALCQQGHWEQTNGPLGGSIRGVVRAADGELFTSVTGGKKFYASTNNGSTWDARGSGFGSQFPYSIAITPSGALLVGTDSSIFRSVDRGQTWVKSTLPALRYYFKAIAMHPDGSIIAASDNKGLYASTDDGATWAELGGGPESSRGCCSMAITPAGEILVGQLSYGGFRSADRGRIWERVHSGYTTQIVKSGTGKLLACVSQNGLQVSEDNGASWTRCMNGLPDCNISSISLGKGGEVFVSLATPGYTENLAVSTDDAVSFTMHYQGLGRTEVREVFTAPGGEHFASLVGGGIYRRGIGDTAWAFASEGIVAASTQAFATLPDGTVLTGGSSGMYRSTNNGIDWEAANTGMHATSIWDLLSFGNGDVYAGVWNVGLFKSTDGGVRWQKLAADFGNNRIWSIAKNPANVLFVSSYGDGVYSSTNQGATWTVDTTGLTDKHVRSLTCSENGMIFAGTISGVFRSSDNGSNWSPANTGLTSQNIYVVRASGSTVFAGSEISGAFRSTNQGQSWTPIAGGLPDTYVQDILSDGTSTIFMVTGMGVYRSTDDGLSWVAMNENFKFKWPTRLGKDQQGRLLLGTDGDAVYRYVSESTGTEITVRSNPAGRSFTVDGTDYSSTQTFDWQAGSVHTIATTQTQSGAAGVRYTWTGWSDGGALSHGITVGSQAQTFTADFRTEYQLQMVSDGAGSVTPQTGWYNPGSTVTIRANPDAGQTFSDWDGTGAGSYTGTDNPAHVTMDGPISETAHFTGGATTREVTITADPPGRRLTVDGENISVKRIYNWEVGSDHEISTSSPQSGAPGLRYIWTGWSNGGAMTHTWNVPAGNAMTLTANFDMEYYLTMTAGSGGTVTPLTSWQAQDSQVSLIATPNSGFRFDRWEGTGANSYTGTMNPVTITMANPVSETAFFTPTTDAASSPPIPERAVLRQNSPNPCSSETVLSFALPRAQRISLVITDILGKEVLRVKDGIDLPAGEHRAVVDVSALTNGMYIYRLETPEGMLVRTMLLIR